jgi:hypothetical protein
MDFRLGVRYERPADKPASWFYDALQEVRNVRVGDVLIQVEIDRSGGVVGLLDGVDDLPLGMHGAVLLETSTPPNLAIPCEDIEAFTLIDDEPPLDRSDELRG